VPGGHRCECGNRGCWEQYASGNALVREARSLFSANSPIASDLLDRADGVVDNLTGPLITAAARDGDPTARELLAEIGNWLGVGIANLAAAFDPGMFVIGGGAILGWAFLRWQRHREATGNDPLVHLDLLKIPTLRSGLIGLFSQNLILMGVFFTIPLYLQLVLGFDALDTGIKMLPVSITMFAASAIGSRLSSRFPVRSIVRAGLWVTFAAALALLATIKPDLAGGAFAVSMGLLGVGMGLMVSQLGNVVQSSVDASGRGEAGGLQYTGQQLGSSLGVALIGALVLAGLASGFVANVENDTRISQEVSAQVSVAVEPGVDFVAADQVEAAAQQAGLDSATSQAIADDYLQAQLRALKAGLLAAAFLALISLAFTGDLPHAAPSGDAEPADEVVTT